MIKAYVGDFGSGKTANAVYDLMEKMKRGRKVISNTPIRFWTTSLFGKKKHYEAEFIPEGHLFQKALNYREKCIFFIDEAAVYLPAQFWNKLPPELIVKFAQNRKYSTDFYYTTQGFGHTVKRLRELTHFVLLCNKYRLFPIPSLRFKIRGHTFGFEPTTIFRAKAYDPAMFRGEWTYKKHERYHRFTRHLYPSQIRRIFAAYDTYYVVDMSAMMKVSGFKQPTRYEDEDGARVDQIMSEINEAGSNGNRNDEKVIPPVASASLLSG